MRPKAIKLHTYFVLPLTPDHSYEYILIIKYQTCAYTRLPAIQVDVISILASSIIMKFASVSKFSEPILWSTPRA